MSAQKICDKCAHYTPAESWQYSPNQGACALMGDSNEADALGADRAAGWDYESYRAGVYVGPKFGCIHWAKKEAA